MKKVGLVLEGGGLRGLYTAGVLDVLMENKIKVDGIIGTSAGALFGVNYFSNQKGRALRYNKEYAKDKRYMSFASLLFTGNYVNKNFAYYKMSQELDLFDNLTFMNANKKFYAVATDVETGEAEYFKITNPLEQMEELRATSAIPGITRIVKINGKKYLDGGVADSIPVGKAISLGYDKIIVVETQPLNYRKFPLTKAMARFMKFKYFRYPKLVEAMLTRYKRYNDCQEDIVNMDKKGEIFSIRPSKKLDIDMKTKDPNKYQEIYDLGVADAKAAIEDLKAYLSDSEEKEDKTPKKRGRKKKNDKEKETKVPKKRGRKPKTKVEDVEKTPKKRGRKPKVKEASVPTEPKRRGRPKGSKNKKKADK